MITLTYHTLSSLALTLLLAFLATSNAQYTFGNGPAAASSDAPNSPFDNNPPLATGYAASDGTPSFANYYFVLLGILIILLCLGYLIVRRSRRRALAQRRLRGEVTTAFEARHWAGQPRRISAIRSPEGEEGLNEEGQAPPPYMPGNSGSTSSVGGDDSGHGIAMQDLGRKPPDYESHATHEEDLNLTRPPAMHHVQGRHTPVS